MPIGKPDNVECVVVEFAKKTLGCLQTDVCHASARGKEWWTVPIAVDGTLEQPAGADGIIDFAAVLTDPANTGYMPASLDSGDDDVHPNDLGYRTMANAIPLSLL